MLHPVHGGALSLEQKKSNNRILQNSTPQTNDQPMIFTGSCGDGDDGKPWSWEWSWPGQQQRPGQSKLARQSMMQPREWQRRKKRRRWSRQRWQQSRPPGQQKLRLQHRSRQPVREQCTSTAWSRC